MSENSILKKWLPILEALSINDDLKEKAAEFAENLQNKENHACLTTSSTTGNLLPINLKIFSKLNLKDKNIIIGLNNVKEFYFSKKIQQNENFNLSLIQILEDNMIDEIINSINNELENNKTIYIDSFVSSISIISEANFAPLLSYIGRYNFS